MKVSELIEKLKDIDPNADVDAEGCDCVNRVVGVDVGPNPWDSTTQLVTLTIR